MPPEVAKALKEAGRWNEGGGSQGGGKDVKTNDRGARSLRA